MPIKKVKNGYELVSLKGKDLGEYPSKKQVLKRARQVAYFRDHPKGGKRCRRRRGGALADAATNNTQAPRAPPAYEHPPSYRSQVPIGRPGNLPEYNSIFGQPELSRHAAAAPTNATRYNSFRNNMFTSPAFMAEQNQYRNAMRGTMPINMGRHESRQFTSRLRNYERAAQRTEAFASGPGPMTPRPSKSLTPRFDKLLNLGLPVAAKKAFTRAAPELGTALTGYNIGKELTNWDTVSSAKTGLDKAQAIGDKLFKLAPQAISLAPHPAAKALGAAASVFPKGLLGNDRFSPVGIVNDLSKGDALSAVKKIPGIGAPVSIVDNLVKGDVKGAIKSVPIIGPILGLFGLGKRSSKNRNMAAIKRRYGR